ncbi:cell wall protein IFF6 [Glossina fuscipes]|uniref:Cell wall protein IFF6 n=1 Tax=Glossina fuscipes TaxID=7396 RepID=A0A9C5Z2F8_9MUSC|nr:cell wall protein IFF6 [Glossina fuscipes]XP_037888239.1 cell wall protein IFF6 [Glossina fuscipes]XP_037888247.1 cell wall protein IFF6 [Glossina fuscipes]
MFNFHKPRTYKSAEGCCICRAKTSSSRFTDSRKYERDAMQCFDLKYPRYGEICNACVLLVKRYKRLPIGSKKNWGHVVDARGGPGSNKLQVKYKSERISSRVNNNSTGQANSIANNSGGGANTSNSSVVAAGGLNFIPEKFNKIFKKSKKTKEPSTSSSPTTGTTGKRKSTSHGWSQNPTNNSLPTTPDSMDSDYEDSRLHGALANTVVQFQTQTRASAHRAAAVADARKKALQMGSKRRKCAIPRKNLKNPIYEESMNFFDDGEWQEKKTCCGMVYECAALAGAIIVDFMHYKPCGVHKSSSQIKSSNLEEKVKMSSALDATTSVTLNSTATTAALQKSIIATMPSVVQIARPLSTPSTLSTTSSTVLAMPTNPASSLLVASPNTASVSGSNTKPTLALKKHYLYYKRQSECFPQGDNVVTNCTQAITQSATPSLSVDPLKTEFENNSLMPQQQQESTISNSSIITETPMPNAITCSNNNNNNNNTIINNNDSSTSNIIISSSSNNSSNYLNTTTPKHSNAKVTTITSPPLITGPCSAGNVNKLLPLGKPQSVLHKIKTNEAGKVIKNSLDKSNMAPSSRLKSGDFPDMKHVIKTVEKSYVLAKPIPTTTQTNNITQINTTQHPYQPLTGNYATTQSLTASLSATSPTSSTSSTSSTKFSDNSSDSGFDENMLDRKSASPLQEDTEKKLLSRPGVQTMFLASGVQIQGQHQNLVFTGNEVAAKILKNRTQQQHHLMATASMPANARSLTNNAATSVKIAQIPTTSLMCIGGNVAATVQAKVRTMYNNNNSIQHENGITTIVPASSLAATNQTAAMNNIQPSTVTITPAPVNSSGGNGGGSGSGNGNGSNINKAQYSSNGNGATVHHQQHQNNMTRKLTAATTTNIINLHSNNLVTPAMAAGHTYGGNHANLSNNLNGNQHHSVVGGVGVGVGVGGGIVNNSISNNAAASLNQKIILLKTSSNVGATITSSNTKYNNSRTLTTAMNNAPTITGGGGGAIGSGVIR